MPLSEGDDMTRGVLTTLVVLAIAGSAGATKISCPAPSVGTGDASVWALSITCDGSTFSNFVAGGTTGSQTRAAGVVSMSAAAGGVDGLRLTSGMDSSGGAKDVTVPGGPDAKPEEHHGSPGSDGGRPEEHGGDGATGSGLGAGSTGSTGSDAGSESAQVPEPATMLLIGTSFIALGMLRRHVRKQRRSL